MNKKRKAQFGKARQGLVALAALCCSAPVWADNSATFNATVSITSTNACTVSVTPATGNAMTAAWNYPGQPATAGALSLTSGNAPAAITVRALGPTGCNLNNFKLRTVMGDGVQPGPTAGGGDAFTFRKSFGSQGGFWRFMPYLANATFYTASDMTPANQAQGTLTWHSPSPGFLLTFGPTATITAGTAMPAVGAMGGDTLMLTDSYVTGGDGLAFLIDSGVNEGYFTSSNATESYQAAQLSFGALLGTDPENVNGVRDPSLATNGDSVTMGWTVYIDQV
ncbi:TPA: hypothetical protein ACGR4L_001050 [Serratia marcescens]